MDVGGLLVPVEVQGLGCLQLVPSLCALGDSLVGLFVDFGSDGLALDGLDLLLGWPDLLQVDILTVFVLGQGLGLKIDVNCTSDGKSDDQRRRSQVVGLGHGVDPAFEVTISTQNRCH